MGLCKNLKLSKEGMRCCHFCCPGQRRAAAWYSRIENKMCHGISFLIRLSVTSDPIIACVQKVFETKLLFKEVFKFCLCNPRPLPHLGAASAAATCNLIHSTGEKVVFQAPFDCIETRTGELDEGLFICTERCWPELGSYQVHRRISFYLKCYCTC